MNEYGQKPELRKVLYTSCYNMRITIVVEHPRSLRINAEYGWERGLVEAVVEVHGEYLRAAEGPYSYIRKGDPCYGDAGWYRMHLRDDGMINVYFTGGFPINSAVGYEVWKRAQQPQQLLHGAESLKKP